MHLPILNFLVERGCVVRPPIVGCRKPHWIFAGGVPHVTVLLPVDFKNLDSKVRMLGLSFTCHFPHFKMGGNRGRVL